MWPSYPSTSTVSDADDFDAFGIAPPRSSLLALARSCSLLLAARARYLAVVHLPVTATERHDVDGPRSGADGHRSSRREPAFEHTPEQRRTALVPDEELVGPPLDVPA